MAIFTINEHKIERVVRVLFGAVLVSLFFVGPETPWGLLGFIPLATGVIGWCPLYAVFGISTCPNKAPDAETPTEA